MAAKTYQQLVAECLPHIQEAFPWDLQEQLEVQPETLIVDIREPWEFEHLRIEGTINVPRGVLEPACEFGYEETVPELALARERPVVLVCRSGLRSALAAWVLQILGFGQVFSLKTGLRGWNDYELPLVDAAGETLALEAADAYFEQGPRPEQMHPVGA